MKKALALLSFLFAAAVAVMAPQAALQLVAVSAVLAGSVFLVANRQQHRLRRSLTPAVNTLPPNYGRFVNGKTLLSSAAVATRYLLGKWGADYTKVAAVAAASDEPIGVITDEASAAGEPLFVELLGLTNRTVPVVAAAAITLNADLYSDGTGKVTTKPTAAGTYWRVGKALQPADADGDVIEMMPMRPRKLIVVSALDSANGALAAASGSSGALAPECEKLGDDVRKIAAALDSNADVALATT